MKLNDNTKCTECETSFPYAGKKSVCSAECHVKRAKRYYSQKKIIKNKICKCCEKKFINDIPGKKYYCSPECVLEAFVQNSKKWREKRAKNKPIRIKKEKKQVRSKKMLIQQLELPFAVRNALLHLA